jgi:predicted DNA-binding protein
MNLTEALNLLCHYQLWRLGEEITMLEPKVITEAINTIIKNFEDRYTKQEFLDAAKLGEVSMIDAKYVVSLLDEVREKNNL